MVIYRLMSPGKGRSNDPNTTELFNRRINIIAIVVSLAPIFMIAMNSIGQLSIVDVALIIVIEAILIFYIIRRTAN